MSAKIAIVLALSDQGHELTTIGNLMMNVAFQICQKVFLRLFLFACLVPVIGHAQSYRQVEATKNITLAVPSDFQPMTDDQIADKYFTNRRPVAMFTDPRNIVDLGVNESQTEWSEADLLILKDFYKANISGLYTEVNYLRDGLEEINGRSYAVFEFESTVADEDNAFSQKPAIRKYTYIQYTIVNGKSWVFNFTVPLRNKEQWQPIAGEIMNSIKIKK
jgi:hypothetical protein